MGEVNKKEQQENRPWKPFEGTCNPGERCNTCGCHAGQMNSKNYEDEINKAFEYGCSVNRNVAKDLLQDYKDLKAENEKLKTIISFGYHMHGEDLINKENLTSDYIEWLETCKKIAEEYLKGDRE